MNHLSLVEAEIARLRAERDALDRRLAEFVATRAVLLELAAKAAAEAGSPPPGKAKPGPAGDPDRPLKLARAMLAEPGLSVARLARAAGMSEPTVRAAFKATPAWFRKTTPDVNSSWELTPEGRKAAAAPSPAA